MTNLQHTKPNIDQYLIAGERPSLNEQEKNRIKAEIQKYLNLLKDNAAVTGKYTWRFPSTNSQTTLTPDEKNEQIAQDNLANLANKDYLIKGLASRIDPELTSQIEELLYEITLQRKLQGESPYTEKAIEMLVIEILYGDFLWRTHRRKAEANPLYFRTHLMAAAQNHAKSGFTSLPRILAALKHDDYEDLLIHKQFENNKLAAKPNPKLLFADLLYIDQVSTPNDTIQTTLTQIQTQVALTVEGLTTIVENETTEKSKVDAEKTKLYFQHILNNIHTAITKVLEQIQNAQTLDGLAEDRRKTKAQNILAIHGTMARVLELESAHKQIIEACLKIIDPKALNTFQTKQTNRINQAIHQQLKTKLTKFANSPYAKNKISHIEITPYHIGQYLDLANPNNMEEISDDPQDTMSEILVITNNQLSNIELKNIAQRIANLIETSNSEISLKPVGNNRGYTAEIQTERFTYQIRINDQKSEAQNQRGIMAANTENKIPTDLQAKINLLVTELELEPEQDIIEAVNRIVLAKPIKVYTGGAKREMIQLTANSTALDFICKLRGSDNRKKLLQQGIKIFEIIDKTKKEINPWETLKSGAKYLIEAPSQQAPISLGFLLNNITEPNSFHILRSEILTNETENQMLETYRNELNQIFNLDNFQFTAEPNKYLHQITTYLKEQSPTTLNLTFNLQDQPGALEKITTYLSQNKINIKGINTSKQTNAKTTVHLEIDPSQTKPTLYHLLKKLLTINYMPGVDEFRIEGRD